MNKKNTERIMARTARHSERRGQTMLGLSGTAVPEHTRREDAVHLGER